MGWDIDEIILLKVRDKILKERYAGCEYSMANSLSPVIIRHREELPLEDRHAIAALFPKWIRVEFQQVWYEAVKTTLYGRGNLIPDNNIIRVQIINQENLTEYIRDKDGNWVKKEEIENPETYYRG